MTRSVDVRRRGFTLIEIMIVVAIIAILIALLVPAVQRVRESAQQTKCQNNLKQLSDALQNFHTANGMYPTYNGIYPLVSVPNLPAPVYNSALQQLTTTGVPFSGSQIGKNYLNVYGSWILHLLPYIEQDSLYRLIVAEVQQNQSNAPGTVVLIPANNYTPGYWTGGSSPTYNLWAANGGQTIFHPAVPATTTVTVDPPGVAGTDYTLAPTTVTVVSGGTPAYYSYSPPRYPDPGSGSPGTYVPAVGTPAIYTYGGGVWDSRVAPTVIPLLLCPSDPSPGTSPYAVRGQVYVGWPDPNHLLNGQNGTTLGLPWGATNYLANWNAITTRNAFLGYQAPPNQVTKIKDGSSNTILLAEAYSWCSGPATNLGTDVKGRSALLAYQNQGPNQLNYGVHNFGLTSTNGSTQVTAPATTEVFVTPGILNQYSSGSITSPPTQSSWTTQIVPANNGTPNPVAPNDSLINGNTGSGGVTVSGTPTMGYVNYGFQIRPYLPPPNGSVPTALNISDPVTGIQHVCNPETVQSPHNVLNVAMADGSVRSLRKPTTQAAMLTWMYLMLPSDGQSVSPDY